MARSVKVSIAGLMGIVLAVSIGLTALLSNSRVWAGTVQWAVFAVLALAAVGAICGTGRQRIRFLGFSVFGWGYMTLLWTEAAFSLTSPAQALIEFVGRHVGIYYDPMSSGHGYLRVEQFQSTAHSLLSLIVAACGGFLAVCYFGAASDSGVRSGPVSVGSLRPRGRIRKTWRAWLAVLAVILLGVIALTRAARSPMLMAGGMTWFTWGCLGLMGVASLSATGRRRYTFMSTALFGIGYMILVFSPSSEYPAWTRAATNELLHRLLQKLPAVSEQYRVESESAARSNARIQAALEQEIPMHFASETPLEDVLAHIVAEVHSPDGRKLQVYIDPIGLAECEKTATSPVSLDMDGVPLRTTLRLMLEQLGLEYHVQDGVLRIDSGNCDIHDPVTAFQHPFIIIGQCLLALFSAGLGGFLSALIYDWNNGPAQGESRPAYEK